MEETYDDRPVHDGDGWSINRVELAGRLVADPVLRHTATRALASLRVATTTYPPWGGTVAMSRRELGTCERCR